jgi:hypothetical protein
MSDRIYIQITDEPNATFPTTKIRKWSYEPFDGGVLYLRQDTPTPVPTEGEAATFQSRVLPWMLECFGPVIPYDKIERGDRFLEEALELLQSGDYPKERAYALIEYVYGRDKGEPSQEVGGVMVTLAAYCLAHGLYMQEAAETELARIWTKVEKIRAKQAAKPTGSALPIAVPAPIDRSNVQLTSGSPVTGDHRNIDPTTGQQKGYVVLTPAERAKGFVRPYRDAYRHLKCGKITTMGRSLAETYACDPGFYSGTFCSTCQSHFPVGADGEFNWYEMDGREGPKVGT